MAKQNRSRKENLSPEAYQRKLEYNREYNKVRRKRRCYSVSIRKGTPMETWVSSKPNRAEYIISLIKKDMEENK